MKGLVILIGLGLANDALAYSDVIRLHQSSIHQSVPVSLVPKVGQRGGCTFMDNIINKATSTVTFSVTRKGSNATVQYLPELLIPQQKDIYKVQLSCDSGTQDRIWIKASFPHSNCTYTFEIQTSAKLTIGSSDTSMCQTTKSGGLILANH